jgi:TonB family protein
MRVILESLLIHLALLGAVALWFVRPESIREEIPVEITEFKRLVETPRMNPQRPLQPDRRSVPAPSANGKADPAAKPAASTAGALIPGAPTDSIGEPLAEEFEVGELPVLVNEVKVPYPVEAKRKRVQGNVVFDLVVGSDGSVKTAKALMSPAPELTEAALGAVRRFRFKPARIGDKSVAIQIRYTYRFVLE